ncbi:MAG: hypothetical protein AXA67_06650 [Methylothermaceae bacteria B42]|nr:MAG: hypothetical protein AXA67_06650 [Methylothermaceae bacteria B42]HHJ39780.1 hypothetical protein [Methylothermaceae bacterium]
MSKILQKAFEEASKLSELEQNELGHWLIEEIITEKKWESILADSEDVLKTLAEEALTEYEQGKTKKLDVDK